MSFVQDQNGQEASVETTQTETPKTSFTVGDRTYDEDSAAKKITNADSHISTLEAELAQERQRIAELEERAAKADELEKALKGNKEEETTKSEPLDVDRLIEEKLAVKEQQRVAESTFQSTSQALVDQFGAANVDSVVAEKMAAVGKTLDDAMRMAADPSDAKVLMALLGSGTTKPQPTFGGIASAASGYTQTSKSDTSALDKIWKSKHGGERLNATDVRETLDSIAVEHGFQRYDPKK